MKLAVVSVLLLLCAVHSTYCTQTQGNIVKKYLKYLRDEGKLTGRLGNTQNLKTRLSLFKTNVKLVEEHNAQTSSYKLGINRFSDLSDGELAQFHGLNASLLQQDDLTTSKPPSLPLSVPTTVDWIAEGMISIFSDYNPSLFKTTARAGSSIETVLF